MHLGSLDVNSYPYIKDKPIKPSRALNSAQTKIGGKKSGIDSAHNPRLFTFVIGGMSHHEVVSISNL